MKTVSRALYALALAVLPLALMGAGNLPQIRTPIGAAIIYSPGDGDFTGFLIVVERSGQAWTSDGAGEGSGRLEPALAQQLFADLASVPPWQLPVRACPASQPDMHGTAVWLNASINRSSTLRHSPNLNCASDPRAEKLLTDAASIRRALYVGAYRVRPMMVFGKTGGYVVTGGSQPSSSVNYSSGSCGCTRLDAGGRFSVGGAFNNGGAFSNNHGFSSGGSFNNGNRFSTSGTLNGSSFSSGGRFTGSGRFENGGRFSNGRFNSGRLNSEKFNSGSSPIASPSPAPSAPYP